MIAHDSLMSQTLYSRYIFYRGIVTLHVMIPRIKVVILKNSHFVTMMVVKYNSITKITKSRGKLYQNIPLKVP